MADLHAQISDGESASRIGRVGSEPTRLGSVTGSSLNSKGVGDGSKVSHPQAALEAATLCNPQSTMVSVERENRSDAIAFFVELLLSDDAGAFSHSIENPL